jgi:hypothetical protein
VRTQRTAFALPDEFVIHSLHVFGLSDWGGATPAVLVPALLLDRGQTMAGEKKLGRGAVADQRAGGRDGRGAWCGQQLDAANSLPPPVVFGDLFLDEKVPHSNNLRLIRVKVLSCVPAFRHRLR